MRELFPQNKEGVYLCIVCKKEVLDYNPDDLMCCNGYMCGCYGVPTEPCFCSDHSFEDMGNIKEI